MNRSIRSIIPVLFPSIGKLQNCPNYFPNHNGRLLSLAVSVVLFLTIRSVVRSRWRSSKAPDPIGRRRSVRDSVCSGSLFWEADASQASFFARSGARLAIHCNHSKRTQCQYQTAVLDRLARNRYNRLRVRPPCAVEMTGAVRNTASSAFYGPCQSQFRIRGELDIAKWCNKVLHFPSFAAKRPRELGMNHPTGWNLSISIVSNCVHFQFPRFTLLKATTEDDGWWLRNYESMILDWILFNISFRISAFFRDKNCDIRDSLNSKVFKKWDSRNSE